jgi:S-DNA-T family DNA segregation ATPase FtsK/SpoIIIE
MPVKSQPRHKRLLRLCLVPIGWAAWLFVLLSMLSYHPADPTILNSSPVYYSGHVIGHNWCGLIGASIAALLINNVGPGAWVLLIMLGAVLVVWSVGGNITQLIFRLLGGTVLIAAVSGLANLLHIGTSLPAGPGGMLGMTIGSVLKRTISTAGSALVLALTLIVGLLLAADEIVMAIFPMTARAWKKMPTHEIASAAGTAAGGLWGVLARGLGTLFTRKPTAKARTTKAAGKTALAKSVQSPIAAAADSPPLVVADEPINAESKPEVDAEPAESASAPEAPRSEPIVRRPKVINIEALLPFRSAPPPSTKQDLGNFRLPGLDLLADAEPANTDGQEEIVRQKARDLEQCLQSFKLDAKVVAIDTGPVVTLYELELAPGIKSEKVGSLSKNIARALKSPPVRIIDNIPGKSTMGVEVPNTDKERVRLKELMLLSETAMAKMALPMCLGKDVSGNPLVEDLARMPHLLIAGTTGSGKSVCINAIIMTLLLTQRPDHVKFIMVDPKMVEMQDYKSVPHLMSPIIDDMTKAEGMLSWVADKMDERYETLSEAGVRHIQQFNQLSREDIIDRFKPSTPEEEARIPFHMPYIVVIIDELADLMMTSKEVESHIVRIAQKARAVGIHLILATQRPEATVVTGLIKSNMPGRICFQVRSKMDSRIMLDQNGGEVLLGQGDMLMLRPTGGSLLRGQGVFVDDAEIKQVCKFLADVAQPEFHPELMQLGAPTGLQESEKDPLFNEAVDIIIETQRGSVSLLQRRLAIGYSRASRLIDQMRAAGIVGAYKGSQASEVNITADEWEQIKNSEVAAKANEPSTETVDDEESQTAEADSEEAPNRN